MFRGFGYNVEGTTEIDEVIRSVSKVNNTVSRILLQEAYDITYQIFDHNLGEHPFDLVLKRSKENVFEYGQTQRVIRRYVDRDVYKQFGLNLVEFLNLPREYTNLIFKVCSEKLEAEKKIIDKVDSTLDSFKSKR